MNKIKVAVVGIGYLGEFHAEKYKNNKNADLIALVDTDRQRREEVSAKLGIKSYGNIKDVVDKVDEDDQVFQNEESRVIIDKTSLQFLEGAEIDYSEELIGSSFKINNPNATSSCGCGTSFSFSPSFK